MKLAQKIKVSEWLSSEEIKELIKLSDLKGNIVILQFTASWCSVCRKEMPHLDRLRSAVKPFNIDVLAISEDKNAVDVVGSFYAFHQLKNLDILIDQEKKFFQALGGRGLPTTLLIDQYGFEVGRLLGVAEWDAPETIRFLKRCLGS